MRADTSAYVALGLDPDADPADVERAYKRLIKLHHPDREGGDARRAAEINRAYRELRLRPGYQQALDFADDRHRSDKGAGRSGWFRVALTFIIPLAVFLVATGPVTALMRKLSPGSTPPLGLGRIIAGTAATNSMDRPVHRAAIDQAIRDAIRVAGEQDDAALLNASNDCRRTLRQKPSLIQLDRCVAFDDTVVELQNRDPLWNGGPFSQSAVTRRQWNAASALSNDYLAVDGRLERIRLQVELALAPRSNGVSDTSAN